MKYLIARLRAMWGTKRQFHLLCNEAADALEAQQAEIEKLKSIAYSDDGAGGEGMKLYLEHRAMKAEIEALRADKDRLDCLEQNPRHAQIVVDGVATDCVFYGISCSQLVKLREAIDAARRK